jgi:peptidoglycan/xylan/chitin deacetylase (PgdA/CDA1 family)
MTTKVAAFGPLPILTYHGFGLGHAATTADPEWFVETLDALAGEGFHCVDLEAWIRAGRPAVDRGFALTFDDGLASILDVAERVVHHGFTATVFVVTDRVGQENDWPGQPGWVPQERLLSWPELLDLDRSGLRLGAHGRTHRRLGRLDAATLADELRGSQDAIEQRTGRACSLFAYPYGDTSAGARSQVRTLFDGGLGTCPGLACLADHPAHLPRVDAYDLRTPAALRSLLEGSLAGRLRLRRVVRAARDCLVSRPD